MSWHWFKFPCDEKLDKPSRAKSFHQDIVIVIMPPSDVPSNAWSMDNGDLLLETLVPPSALEGVCQLANHGHSEH